MDERWKESKWVPSRHPSPYHILISKTFLFVFSDAIIVLIDWWVVFIVRFFFVVVKKMVALCHLILTSGVSFMDFLLDTYTCRWFIIFSCGYALYWTFIVIFYVIRYGWLAVCCFIFWKVMRILRFWPQKAEANGSENLMYLLMWYKWIRELEIIAKNQLLNISSPNLSKKLVPIKIYLRSSQSLNIFN